MWTQKFLYHIDFFKKRYPTQSSLFQFLAQFFTRLVPSFLANLGQFLWQNRIEMLILLFQVKGWKGQNSKNYYSSLWHKNECPTFSRIVSKWVLGINFSQPLPRPIPKVAFFYYSINSCPQVWTDSHDMPINTMSVGTWGHPFFFKNKIKARPPFLNHGKERNWFLCWTYLEFWDLIFTLSGYPLFVFSCKAF